MDSTVGARYPLTQKRFLSRRLDACATVSHPRFHSHTTPVDCAWVDSGQEWRTKDVLAEKRTINVQYTDPVSGVTRNNVKIGLVFERRSFPLRRNVTLRSASAQN